MQFLQSAECKDLKMDIIKNGSGNVSNGYWNRDNKQANLSRNDPDNQNENCGSTAAVSD